VTPAPDLIIRATKDNGIGTIIDYVHAGTRLLDENGASIQIGQVVDANLIVRVLEGDLNHDCTITVIDDQSIASRYPSTFGSLIYNRLHDLEPAIAPDEDIDIKDLQFVFGRNGSTCENPRPEQNTPTPVSTPGTPVVVTATPTSTATVATSTPEATSTPTTGPTDTPTVVGANTSTPTATRTRTPTSGSTSTPTPSGGSTSTPNASTRTAEARTATPDADSSSTPRPGTTRTQTPGVSTPDATRTRISTVVGSGPPARPPRVLPGTGGGSYFPGGTMGGVVILVVVVILVSAYVFERGRQIREDEE
jgi:hypothetical protein